MSGEVSKTILFSSNKTSIHNYVTVKVNYDKSVSDQKIIDAVKKIYLDWYDHGQIIKDLEISTSDLTHCKVNRSANTTTKTPLSDLVVKVFQASDIVLSTRTKTFSEIYTSLYETWPGKIPILHYFWMLAVYPLAALIRLFPPSVYDHLTELKKLKLPHDEDSLLTTLKWVRETFSSYAEGDPLNSLGKEFTLCSQLAEAESLGRDWHDLSKQASLPELSAKEIMRRYNSLKQHSDARGKAINLMFIPTGYWSEEGIYQTVILSLYRNDKGKFCLSEISSGDNQGATSHDYEWEEMDEATLKFLLSTLMNRSKQPNAEQQSPFQETKVSAIYVGSVGDIELNKLKFDDSTPKTKEKPLTEQEFRDKVYFSAKANKLKPREGSRKKGSDDPDKRIFEAIRKSFPEHPLSDKTIFTFGILSNRLEKIIVGLPQMNEEEKVRWIEILEKDVRSFQRLMRNTFGNEAAFNKLLETDSPFKKLCQRLKELSIEVDNLPSMLTKRREARAETLNDPNQGNYLLTISTDIKPIGEVSVLKSQSETQISPEDLKLVDSVIAGWQSPSQDNLEKTLKSLALLAERIDKLVDQKAYVDVNKLYRSIMPFLPTPRMDSTNNNFWKVLASQAEVDISSQVFIRFCDSLTKISQYNWETKIKTGDLPLKPDEWVYEIKTQAAITQSIFLRQTWIKTVLVSPNCDSVWIKNNLNTIKNNTKGILTFDDIVLICFNQKNSVLLTSMLLFHDYNKYVLLEKLNQDPYARPSLSTHLEEQLIDLRQFCLDNDLIDYSSSSLHSRFTEKNLLENPKEIIKLWEAWQGLLPLNDEEQKKALQEIVNHLFSRVTDLSRPRIPNHIADLYRHQLMMITFVFPETVFIHPFKNILHTPSLMKTFIQGAATSERVRFQKKSQETEQKQNEIKEDLYKGVRALLLSLNRIEILSFSFHIPFDIFSKNNSHPWFMYGIGERGQKPGTNADIVLDEKGINFDTKQSLNETIQITSMGNPKKDYYNKIVNVKQDSETEASLLSAELNQLEGNPVENWLLSCLEVKDESSWGTKSEFSPENSENVFNLILNRTDLLDQPDARRRFLAVFGRPHLIQRLLRRNPDYFLEKAPLMKQAIEHAIKQGCRERAAFMLWMGTHIAQAAELGLRMDANRTDPYGKIYRDPQIDQTKLKKIITSFPSLTTKVVIKTEKKNEQIITLEQLGGDLLLEWLKGLKLSVDEQMDYSSYLLESLSSHPDHRNLDKIDFLKSPETVAQLLIAVNRLRIGYQASTVPVIGQMTVLWAEEVLSPWIRAKSTSECEKILNQWVRFQEDVQMDMSIPWKKGEKNLWEKTDGTLVDLERLQVLKVLHKEAKALQVNLPTTILKSTDYQQLFGNENFASSVYPGLGKGQYIYQFEDAAQQKYRILYDQQDHTLQIEKYFNTEFTGEPGWYRFIKPKVPDGQENSTGWISTLLMMAEAKQQSINKRAEISHPKGIEQRIAHDGVWINTQDPREGLVVLNNDITKMSRDDVLSITFDRSGHLYEMCTLDGATVVHDPAGRLNDILNPTHESQILFLSSSMLSNAITEIRLLDQGITLVRNSFSATWTVKEGKFKGCQWMMEGAGTLLEKKLLPFGINVEQFGLVLYDPRNKETHLVMWPQALVTPEAHRKTGSEKLNFIKEGPFTPVKVTFDEEGRSYAACEGYLTVASLCAAKSDYQTSLFYINKAVHARLEETHEIATVKKIEEIFRLLPANTIRSRIIKLKAALQISRILRQQTLKCHFSKKEWKTFLTGSQYIGDLYQAYLKGIVKKNKLPELTTESSQKELSLSSGELCELKRINEESMSFLLKEMTCSELTPSEKALWVELPSFKQAPSFIQLLVATMAPNANHEQCLNKLTHPSNEIILSHFFYLWNLIIEDQLTQVDLIPLFKPLFKEKDLESIKDPSSVASHADMARKVLLALVTNTYKSGFKKFDLEALQQIRQSLPTGILGLGWQLFLGSFLSERKTPLETAIVSVCSALEPIFKQNEKFITIGYNRLDPSTIEKEQTTSDQRRKVTKKLSLDALQEKLDKDPHAFGPAISQLLKSLLSHLPSKERNELEKLQLDEAIVMIEGLTQINAAEELREAEMTKRVNALEKKLLTHKPLQWPDKDPILQKDPLVGKEAQQFATDFSTCLEGCTGAWTLDDLQNEKKKLISFLTGDKKKSDPIEASNKEKLLKGIEKAAENLTEVQKNLGTTIALNKLEQVKEVINAERNRLKSLASEKKEAIFKALSAYQKKENLPEPLLFALANENVVDKATLFDAALDAYQKRTLNRVDDPTLAQIEKDITLYLIYHVSFQQLNGRAQQLLSELDRLSQNSNQTAVWQAEWNLTSSKLIRVVDAAKKLDRYLDADGALLHPRINRKALVSEERQQFIFMKSQYDLILKIIEKPDEWEALGMGLGKTTKILPMIFLLFAEQNIFPIGLIKEELLRQNVDSLDKSTRLMLDTAGVEFTFDMQSEDTPAVLAEQYYRLLKVKEDTGYPISTLATHIYLTHKLSVVDTALQKALESQDDNTKKSVHSLTRQRYWLCKIRDLFRGDEKKFGFKTLNFLDEIDSQAHIRNEINVAIDKLLTLNKTICNMMELLLENIYTSKNKDIIRLKNALLDSQQATLVPDDIKETILPTLVKELFEKPDFLTFLGFFNPDSNAAKKFKAQDKKAFVDYICKTLEIDAKSPMGSWVDNADDQRTQLQNGIAALKHLIQTTFTDALSQHPGIDLGIKSSDGFTIGPKTYGQDKLLFSFSEVYDLICKQYLLYSAKLPENEFMRKALKEYQQNYPNDYQAIENKAVQDGEKDLITYLNRKENWKERLQLLRKTIIQNNLIKRFEKQLVMNVHAALEGLFAGGVTGTLKTNILPNRKTQKDTQQPECVIEADTLLRIGLTKPGDIEVVEEGKILETLGTKYLTKPECKAILNEGCSLGDILSMVTYLRTTEGGKNRIFVFTHSLTRLPQIWYPNDKEPQAISKKDLEDLALEQDFKERCVFVYNPADKIGTDYRIPIGYAVFIPGPTTNREGIQQTACRVRELGTGHQFKTLMSTAIAARIRSRSEIAQNTPLTHLNLFDDVMQTSLHEEKGLNLKATFENISSIVTICARDIDYCHYKRRDEPDFWDLTKSKDLLDDIAINNVLTDTFSTLFIQSKEVNFKNDFMPTSKQSLKKKVEELYQDERNKLKAIRNKLVPQFRELLKRSPDTNSFAQERIADIYLRLYDLEKQLTDSEKAFFEEASYKEHMKYLPEEILTTGSGIPNVQEQVQQQQQQQQTQQQQQQIQGGMPKKNIRYEACDFHLPWKSQTSYSSFSQLKLGSCFDSNLRFSSHMEAIFNQLPLVQGDPIGRLLIIDDDVSLISNQDYQVKLLDKIKGVDDPHRAAICTLLNGAQYGQGLSIDQSGKYAPDFKNNSKLRRALIQLKIILGYSYSQLSKDELEDLRLWLEDVKKDSQKIDDLFKFIHEKGNKDQQYLIEKIIG